MAAMRTLTVAGLFLAFFALGLIAVAISTDNWYETDARRHRERCKNYSNKRNDPGYIYISNLPLRMLPSKERHVDRKGSGVRGEMLLLRRAKRHFLPPAPAMESLCSRHFNSTITGLWRKCHREGFDLETEDLIFKGLGFVFLFYRDLRTCVFVCANALSKVLMLRTSPEGLHPAPRGVQLQRRVRVRGTCACFPLHKRPGCGNRNIEMSVVYEGVGGWMGGGGGREGGILEFVFFFVFLFSADILLFTSTGLVPRCTPIKYYYSSSALPRHLPINLINTIRQDEWHALREFPLTGL